MLMPKAQQRALRRGFWDQCHVIKLTLCTSHSLYTAQQEPQRLVPHRDRRLSRLNVQYTMDRATVRSLSWMKVNASGLKPVGSRVGESGDGPGNTGAQHP